MSARDHPRVQHQFWGLGPASPRFNSSTSGNPPTISLRDLHRRVRPILTVPLPAGPVALPKNVGFSTTVTVAARNCPCLRQQWPRDPSSRQRCCAGHPKPASSSTCRSSSRSRSRVPGLPGVPAASGRGHAWACSGSRHDAAAPGRRHGRRHARSDRQSKTHASEEGV